MAGNNETSIIISAVDKTEAALNSVKGNLGQVGSEVGRLQGLVAGFAAVAGVTAFAGMIKGSIESMAALQDLSERTGATVDGLSAMRSVARLTGTDMDSIAGALQKLSKNMVSLDDEGKDATRAIAAIGLEAGKLKNMKPDQAMLEIAEALSGFQDGAEKTAVAMALFGKAGANALPFLKDLAEVGKLNAKVTAEQAQMADDFEKNLKKLSMTGQGWQKEIAAGMLPALNSFSEAALETINGVGGLREEMRKLAADGSIEAWVTATLNGLTRVMDAAEGAYKVVIGIGRSLAAAAAYSFAQTPEQAKTISAEWKADMDGLFGEKLVGQRLREAFEKNAAAKKQALDDYSKSVSEVMAAYAGYDTKIQQEAMKRLRDSFFGEEKAKLGKIGVTLGDDAGGVDQLTKLLDRINGKDAGLDATYWKDLKTLNDAYGAGKLSLDAYAAAVGKMTQQQKFALDITKKEDEANKALAESFKGETEALKNVAKAKEDSLRDYGSLIDSLTLEAETLGLSSEARERYIAIKKLDNDYTRGLIDSETEYLARLDEINAAFDRRDAAKGSADAAKQAAADWKKTGEEIERSITDALMRGFESGKGFAQNLRDTLVNIFKSMVLRPVISAVVQGGLTAIGLGAAGSAAAGAGGTAGNVASGLSIGNSIFGGSGSMFSALGSSAMFGNTAFGGGLTLAGSEGIFGGFSAGLELLSTGGSSMAALGAMLPGIGTAIAAISLITSLMGKGGGPKTGGDAYLSYTGDSASTMSSTQLARLMPNLGGNSPGVGFYTPDNGNATASQLLAASGSAIASTIKSLGGSMDGMKLGIGYDTDPAGTASSRVHGGVYRADGTAVYDRESDVGRDADMNAAMTLELQRMTIAAISAADGIKPVFKAIAEGIDLTTATAEQLTATLTQLSQMKTVVDFAAFDPFETYKKSQETAAAGVMGAVETQRAALVTLLDAYDGSAAATANLAAATQSMASASVAAVAFINQSLDSLHKNTQADSESMYLSTLDNKAQYDYRVGLSGRIEDQISTAQTPEEIVSLYEAARANYQAGFGLLDEAQKKASGASYYGTLNQETGQFEGGYLGDLATQVAAALAPFGQTLADLYDPTDAGSLSGAIAAAFDPQPIVDAQAETNTLLAGIAASLAPLSLLGTVSADPATEPDAARPDAEIAGKQALASQQPPSEMPDAGIAVDQVLALQESAAALPDGILSAFGPVIQQMVAAALAMQAAANTPVQVDAAVSINATLSPGVEVTA